MESIYQTIGTQVDNACKLLSFSCSRGTNQFSVYTSPILNAYWNWALTENLPDARSVAECSDIPTLSFDVNQSGRFVKVTFDSYYGYGPGIQYIDILYKQPCTGKEYGL